MQPSRLLLEIHNSKSETGELTNKQIEKYLRVSAQNSHLNVGRGERIAGKRENVLSHWQQGIKSHNINIQYNSEVTHISGEHPQFSISLKDGSVIQSENIVLSIGLQGNPRKLGIDNDSESDFVRYTLEDPDAFDGKTIVVIGAGDAAVSPYLGLMDEFQVYNRALSAEEALFLAGISTPRQYSQAAVPAMAP